MTGASGGDQMSKEDRTHPHPYRVTFQFPGQEPVRVPKLSLYGAAMSAGDVLRRGGEVDVLEVGEDQAETLLCSLTPADLPDVGEDGPANGYVDADHLMKLLTGLEKPEVGGGRLRSSRSLQGWDPAKWTTPRGTVG
jgi:hypothetical protein